MSQTTQTSEPRLESSGSLRQKLLVLYLARAELSSKVVAWTLYDGTGAYTFDSSEPPDPPYTSALEAMRAGWRVLQMPLLLPPVTGQEYEVNYLRYPVVLEQWGPCDE